MKVHEKSTYVRTARHPDRQTDGIFFGLFCLLRHTNHEHLWKGENFFFHSCDYNTFSRYILRMWWESKKLLTDILVCFPQNPANEFFQSVIHRFFKSSNSILPFDVLKHRWKHPSSSESEECLCEKMEIISYWVLSIENIIQWG